MRVASIGECMVEFSAATDGLFARGFGGDTLNTALYLARLGVDTSYVTAPGRRSAQRRHARGMEGGRYQDR